MPEISEPGGSRERASDSGGSRERARGWAALYQSLYSHLQLCRVDGVKIDGQVRASLGFRGSGIGEV